MKSKLAFVLILLLAFLIRIFGLNWDQGFHLHPDERFLTMVVSDIKLPPNISNYFDASKSTLNPYNHNYNFYVYGTFPLLVVRLFGEIFNKTTYDQIYLVGRYVSVFFDLSTLIVLFILTKLLFKKDRIALCASFIYAISVLPIQQAHFFTSDSFLVFFSTLTVYFFTRFMISKKLSLYYIMLPGFFFGLTLANKISILATAPVFLIFSTLSSIKPTEKIIGNIFFIINNYLFFTISAFISFRLFQPYAFDGLFTLSKHFIDNINEARNMINGVMDYPPNIQWAYTKPLIHPFINIFLWGMGPPITLAAIIGVIIYFIKSLPNKRAVLFLLSFCTFIFIYQGIQLAKYMRYFYPIYPIMAVFAGITISYLNIIKLGKFKNIFKLIMVLLLIYWPVAFISIYSKMHSRVAASYWINNNIKSGSKITAEEWDDSLPLSIAQYNNQYQFISLALYGEENIDKWNKIITQLKEADYIILTSNRLYQSIPKLPQRYPMTTLYYKLLFNGKLGFKKIKEFASYPEVNFEKFKFEINDNSAEESFTVYDHPKIIIFKKISSNPNLLLPLNNTNLINKSIYINPNETNNF